MKFSVSIALLAASAVWAADPVPMDVKTGQWETTVISQASNIQIPQLSADQLSKMPPDQRARLEAIMKQAMNRTSTSKGCVKKEDLTKLPFNSNKNCKTTVVSSSRSKQVLHLDCDFNGTKQAADMTIEAASPESVKFSVQSTGAATLNINGTSKWLSQDCPNSK